MKLCSKGNRQDKKEISILLVEYLSERTIILKPNPDHLNTCVQSSPRYTFSLIYQEVSMTSQKHLKKLLILI